ncbi:MAG: hypothetical protein HY906_05265 [Deltaproteobacteria bacterium]|nr:hypothetical protein [Deltaproteobacteria bacterium]
MDYSTLRRAARFLTPASLQLAAGQPRRLTFVCDVRRHRGETRLTLSPIGGPPCTGEWGVLDFRLDGQDLKVAGPILEHREREVTLAVRRDLEVRPPRRGRVTAPAGSLVAVFVPEGTGLGRCCQPVLDIGLRALRLQSSFPFEAGVLLRDLTVLAGAQVVRRAEGIVVHSAPVLQVDGEPSYHCGVRLRRPTAVPPPDDPADELEVTEPTRVRTILWGLSDLAHSVTLRAGTVVVRCQLAPVRGSRDALPEIRCTMETEAPVTGPVQVECALYGSGYRFYARVRRRDGCTLFLRPAPVVREWHRREEERLTLPAAAGGKVTFHHPIDGRPHERPLVDVSVQGFGFAREAEEDALWPGLPLKDVTVQVAGQAVRPAHVTVRTVGEQRCGVQMDHLGEREADRLRFELMKLSAYPVEFHDGEDLDEIVAFHQRLKVFEGDQLRNLAATLDDTRRNWRAAHQHPDGLMRTAVVRWKGDIGGATTLVLAFEGSWLLQHQAVASPAVPTTLGSLHSTLVRLALPRRDCEHVFGFVDEEARSVHTVVNSFLTEWSTPEHRGASRLVLYAGEACPPTSRVLGARRLGGADERLIENAGLRVLHPVCARALGLRVGHLRLRNVAAAWRLVGLERGRETWGAFGGGRPVAFLLRQWASPGLSLSSLLSTALYLPVRPDGDGAAAQVLVRVLLETALPGDPPVRLLLAPEEQDPAPLVAAGLRRVAGCTLYALQGVGMQEYHRYMASRYGFLYGRLRARVAAPS